MPSLIRFQARKDKFPPRETSSGHFPWCIDITLSSRTNLANDLLIRTFPRHGRAYRIPSRSLRLTPTMPGRNSDEQKGRLLGADDIEEGIELQSSTYQKEQLYRPQSRPLVLLKTYSARAWTQAKDAARNSGPYARQFGSACARYARYLKDHGPTHLRQVKEKVWTQETRFYLFVVVLAVLYGTASWSFSKTYRQRHKISFDMIRGKPSALYGDLDSISAGLNVYNEVQCLVCVLLFDSSGLCSTDLEQKRLQSNEKWRELYFPGQSQDQLDVFQTSTGKILRTFDVRWT